MPRYFKPQKAQRVGEGLRFHIILIVILIVILIDNNTFLN